MNQLLQRLHQEHECILRALDAFEAYLNASLRSKVDPSDLPRFLLFFREYVDLIHNDLEERVLLPTLASKGQVVNAGTSARLKEQHSHERHILQNLVRSAFRRGGCLPSDPEIHRHARAFLDFQRMHIEKENAHFGNLSDNDLTVDRDTLRRALAQFDAEQDTFGRAVWLERLLNELTAAYDPSSAPARSLRPGSIAP